MLTLLEAALGLRVSPAARPRSAHALRAALRMAELNVDPSKDATAFNPADEIDMDVGPAEDGLPEVEWTPSVRGESPTPRDKKFGPLGGYCADPYVVERRKSRTVTAGPVKFGSDHPIVRQTMLTTLTSDVEGTIEQAIRCADEGFDLVRITVVGMKDAKACVKIREGLDARGYDIPLCADMHFQPKVAIKVAEAVEKIRINPGNFADGRKSFEEIVTRPTRTTTRTATTSSRCSRRSSRSARSATGRCGSAPTTARSRRAPFFYGDTPRRMVESAIEFADICRASFYNFVFSMKASNPLVCAGVPPPRQAVPPRLGLPAPPRRHRGGRGRGRTDEADRDRRAPRRRPGRHDPRLAHRGPRARACNRLAEIGAG